MTFYLQTANILETRIFNQWPSILPQCLGKILWFVQFGTTRIWKENLQSVRWYMLKVEWIEEQEKFGYQGVEEWLGRRNLEPYYPTWYDYYIHKALGEEIFQLIYSLQLFLKSWFEDLKLPAMTDSLEFQYYQWGGKHSVYCSIIIAYWIVRDLEAYKLLDSSLLLPISKLNDYCGTIIALVDKIVFLGWDACGWISMPVVEVG